ncbi:MAG: type I restriction-modification system subunit M N-terminal domain-containing protein [Mariprofundaceae bacterium]|nr:type I restriction-modification system subunit M N-terminal domain-containing protein [Mariprofundaceae bacterium]
MSEEEKRLLQQQIWNIANTLRGKMGADEFRDYILGYLIQARYVRLQIMRFAQGVSVLGISKGNVAKVLVQMPTVGTGSVEFDMIYG